MFPFKLKANSMNKTEHRVYGISTVHVLTVAKLTAISVYVGEGIGEKTEKRGGGDGAVGFGQIPLPGVIVKTGCPQSIKLSCKA